MAKVTIFGEAADDSPAFVETELINGRSWTTASVAWKIAEPRTMQESYRSLDFKTVIQEIVDRAGWASGNDLTIFLSGEDQEPACWTMSIRGELTKQLP